MNEIDERNSTPTEESSPAETPRPPRKRKPVSRAAAEKGFKAKFAAFMRNLNDPGYFRKKRLPDPSEYPEGQVPLWVSDPDHYEKKKSKTRRFFSVFGTVCLHLFLIFCMIGIVVLEFSTPRNFLVRKLYQFYSNHFMKPIGGLVSRDRKAYNYLPDSIVEFSSPEEFLTQIERAGFEQCRRRSQSFGIAQIYIGKKA